MAEHQLPKLTVRVRFPSSAPLKPLVSGMFRNRTGADSSTVLPETVTCEVTLEVTPLPQAAPLATQVPSGSGECRATMTSRPGQNVSSRTEIAGHVPCRTGLRLGFGPHAHRGYARDTTGSAESRAFTRGCHRSPCGWHIPPHVPPTASIGIRDSTDERLKRRWQLSILRSCVDGGFGEEDQHELCVDLKLDPP